MADNHIEATHFYSGPGHKLAADIYWPSELSDERPAPGVVILHGFTAIKKFLVNTIAERFAEAGYVALTFDYRGYGDSEGPRHRLMPLEQVEDSRNALSFLSNVPQVDEERIGVVGVSFGGAIGLAIAASDQRVRCLSCNGAVSNGERWMRSIRREWEWLEFLEQIEEDSRKRVRTGESERVSPWEVLIKAPDPTNFIDALESEFPDFKSTLPLESAQAVIEFKPEENAGRIACPVKLIHVEKDPLVPTQESRQAHERCPGERSLVILPVPARMDLYQKHFDTMVEHHLDWHRQHNPVGAVGAQAA